MINIKQPNHLLKMSSIISSYPQFEQKNNYMKAKPNYKKNGPSKSKLYSKFKVILDQLFGKVLTHDLDTLNPEEHLFIISFPVKIWTQMFWTHMKKNCISLYWEEAHTQKLFSWCEKMNKYHSIIKYRNQYLLQNVSNYTNMYGQITPQIVNSICGPLPPVPTMPHFLRFTVECVTALNNL